MPVATVAITGRRAADDAISKTFGSRACSAHTPSPIRPGPLGAKLSEEIASNGFPIATAATAVATRGRLVEVYPHPALLSLLQRNYRVPYKVSNARRYWPAKTREERLDCILRELAAIYNALTSSFGSLPFPLPSAVDIRALSHLKRYEDALDALICAWVGVRYLDGAAIALGNDTAAIWCPLDIVSTQLAARSDGTKG